jgi:hypothetical protein
MPESESVFPDDVPIADAVEQQQPTSDSPADDDEAAPWQYEGDVPLETAASDWQEQRDTVLVDPEQEEPERPD